MELAQAQIKAVAESMCIEVFIMGLKQLCKDFVPPLLWRLAQRTLVSHAVPVSFSGNYPDWQSAQAASTGYDSDAIFGRVLDAARKVKNGEALWERDSVPFDYEEYNFPLLSALMSVAAWNKGKLRVLDFGGAFGSTYWQHRCLLQKLEALCWNVVEQSQIVSCGQKEFQTDELQFWPDMQSCVSVGQVDVVLFSSVLQYMEDPYELLEQAMDISPKAIILDRTPFAENGERITVQNVPPTIYPASYACRWLDKPRVKKILESNYCVSPWWQSQVDQLGFLGIMGYH